MRRIVDLTYPIHEGMTTYPRYWHPLVEVSLLGRLNVEGRETRRIVLGTHTGTHCDAPCHFIAGGKTIDNLSLDALIGAAVVVNFSDRPPHCEIQISDLERYLGNNTPERLIMRFDWSKHWGTPDFYKNHQFLSLDAAEWLVGRGVRLLAMDTPTPDDPSGSQPGGIDSPVHKILLGNGIILVEYLCNLKELWEKEIDLIVLPLKVLGGDGAPARCVAVEYG